MHDWCSLRAVWQWHSRLGATLASLGNRTHGGHSATAGEAACTTPYGVPHARARAMPPPAFGESLAQLDAIIAKLEGPLEGAGGAEPAAAQPAAAAPGAPLGAEAEAPAPKAGKKPKAPAPAPKKQGNAPAGPQPLFTKLDLRVGKIVKVWEHPDSEKLWCEEIDVGEDKPRQIVSGLRAWYSKEEMLGKRLIAVCNLKTAKLGGVPSAGMVMCAQTPKVRPCRTARNQVKATRMDACRLSARVRPWRMPLAERPRHAAAGRGRKADRGRVHRAARCRAGGGARRAGGTGDG